MAEQDNAQQEPTMEEILASIRRIISEDGDEEQQAGAAAKGDHAHNGSETADPVFDAAPESDTRFESEEETSEEASGGDVLELTDIVSETDQDEAAASAVAEPSVEDEVEMIEKTAAAEPGRIEDEEEAAVRSVSPQTQDSSLLSPEKAAATSSVFQELSRRVRVSEGDPQSLEYLVQEMMRPMLSQWLDTHLPRIVEKVVEKEVRRLAAED